MQIAPEPTYDDLSWVSAYDIDPFEVSTSEKSARLVEWTRRLLDHPTVQHASASLSQVHECKFYADLTGTTLTQQRIRLMPTFEAMGADADSGVFDSMTSIAPPGGARVGVRRGQRALGLGRRDRRGAGSARRRSFRAPSVTPGTYDLVIHPSNLWLTIHESIGHATELDRALGYEANYAGTSFATYDQLAHCAMAPSC